MVHIPSLRNAFLSLGAGVDVEASGQDHEGHVLQELILKFTKYIESTYRSNVAIGLVLLASTRDGQEEDNDPWDTDLSPHLEVDGAKTGVQASTHEVVVEEVAGHADCSASHDGVKVGEKGDTKAVNHGDGHEMAVVVDDLGEAEDVEVVQRGGGDESHVEAGQGVAVVHEGLVVERGDGETFLLVSGENPSNEELEEKVARVDFPGVRVRAGVLCVIDIIRRVAYS